MKSIFFILLFSQLLNFLGVFAEKVKEDSSQLNSVKWEKLEEETKPLKKIIWRAFKIYLVGVFLWVFPDFDLTSIRWVGVLQRISFVFLFCGLIYLFIDKKLFIYISFITLILYWFIMLYIPVPGIGTPNLTSPELNLAHYIDSKFF